MALVDCGHPPIIHYLASRGDCIFHKNENLPLGLAEDQTYQVVTVPLKPGDVLLFYSDGIMEAQSDHGEEFGLKRLAEIVKNNHYLPASELIEKIKEGVAVFSHSQQFKDDFSCIAVHIKS